MPGSGEGAWARWTHGPTTPKPHRRGADSTLKRHEQSDRPIKGMDQTNRILAPKELIASPYSTRRCPVRVRCLLLILSRRADWQNMANSVILHEHLSPMCLDMKLDVLNQLESFRNRLHR